MSPINPDTRPDAAVWMPKKLLKTLKDARAWLATLAAMEGRPETSDVHRVLAELDAAIDLHRKPQP